MTYPLPMTREEAYLAYKAGVIEEGDLKPSLNNPRNQFEAWLAYWCGLTNEYPISSVGKNLAAIIPRTLSTLEVSYDKTTGAIEMEGTYSGWARIGDFIGVKYSAGDYTFSIDSAKTYSVNMRLYYSSDDYTNATIPVGDTSVQVSMDQPIVKIGLYVRLTEGTEYDETIYCQLEKGDTATEFEPYNGSPLMITDEEACIAYLAGVTDTYPENLKDPRDPRLVGYLKYLISARFGRPKKPLTRSELYLSLIKPPVVTNDTPSADIELDNTAEAPFIDVKAYGDTSQTTYTGKNLLGTQTTSDVYHTTILTNTANELSMKPTAGGNSFIECTIPASADTQYTASMDIVTTGVPSGSTYEGTVYWYSINSGGTSSYIDGVTKNGHKTKTFTTKSDTVSLKFRFFSCELTNTDWENIKSTYSNIQVEAGSTATAFEPYVGGIPAPNPDYPQPVNVVTGRQVVDVRGKNLLPITMESQELKGVVYTVNDDKSITMVGKATSRSEPNIYVAGDSVPKVVLKAGVEYHNSMDNASLYLYTGTYRLIIANGSYTPTNDEVVEFAYIRVESGETVDMTIYPQLERGDTATDYEPYQAESYEINLGKNLLDNPIDSGAQGSLSWVRNSDGSITLNGTAPSGGKHIQGSYKMPQEWLGKTLTLSLNNSNPNMNAGFKAASGGGNQFIIDYSSSKKTQTITQTNINGTAVFELYVKANSTFDNFTVYPMVEIGDTATTYAPYFEPIELCKIGDYQDYIYRDGEDWYVRKSISKIRLDSSLGFELGQSGSSRNRFAAYGVLTDMLHQAYNYAALCNYLIAQDVYTQENIGFFLHWYQGGAIYVGLPKEEFPTKESLDTWLDANDVFVYYQKLEAVDTQITNSALIDQLDALVEGGSYEGKTYIKIEATDPNLPALLKVEAGLYR